MSSDRKAVEKQNVAADAGAVDSYLRMTDVAIDWSITKWCIVWAKLVSFYIGISRQAPPGSSENSLFRIGCWEGGSGIRIAFCLNLGPLGPMGRVPR